jgi:Cu(I)/Ag(I) efflux system membrane fusion protein
MKRSTILMSLGAAALVLAAGLGSYRLGLQRGKAVVVAPAVPAPATAAPAEKKVLYWHDPMVPGQRFDKPGKSPFMDMQLVPVYADEGEGVGKESVSVDARMRQNLGIRTAEVTTGSLAAALQAVGTVAFDERSVALVQARSGGYVEHLFVRAPMERVRKGQPLLRMLAPDWVAAQEDYLAIRRMGDVSPMPGLLDAARQRMRLAGMSDAQVKQVEAGGKPNLRITVVAPVSGVVTELNAREGMTLAPGAPLFRINGFDTVWVNAEVPEAAVARVGPGSAVEASVTALPGQVFKGKVGAILPEVNLATRTLKARIELANPKGELVPGMFASVRLTPRLTPSSRPQALLVPSEAVIRTGTRSVVMLALGDGRFSAVDVETGLEANGMTEIRKGVSNGQKVVVSGQFLIDSEASLRGSSARTGDSQ